MGNTRWIFLLSIVVLCMSCAKQDNTCGQSSGPDLILTDFTAGFQPMTRTAYMDGKIYWESTDRIDLFSGQDLQIKTELSVVSLSEDASTAVFQGFVSESATECLAVYPSSQMNTYSALDGVLTLDFPSEQRPSAYGCMSGANVSVAWGKSADFTFSNVGALVGVRLPESGADIVRISLKAKTEDGHNFGLSGVSRANINISSEEVTAGEGSSATVDILPPGKSFSTGVTYYVSVIPGNYSSLEFSCVDGDGNIYEWTENEVTGLSSGCVRDFGIPDSVFDKLPEEVTIDLNFYQNWPFVEPVLDSENQKQEQKQSESGDIYIVYTGDVYTLPYEYSYEGKSMTAELKFLLRGNLAAYNHTPAGMASSFSPGSANARMAIPGVADRYLKSVTMSVRNGEQYKKGFRLSTVTYADIAECESPAYAGSPAVLSFPVAGQNSIKGMPYFMYFTNGSTSVTSIRLVYTKSQPVAEK